MMLRDIGFSVNELLDCTDPRVGVLASEIPTGFARPAFLLNDVDTAFPNRLYSLEILTLPSAGTLYLDKTGAGSFSGAPIGKYTGLQRVKKFDVNVGLVSVQEGSYTLDIVAAQPTVTGVTITPTSATGSQQFSATVQGTNGPSQIVNWSASAGTISATGLFTAPLASNVQQIITITAKSAQDPTKVRTATVTIAALAPPTVTAVTVSPDDAAIVGGDVFQFIAVVSGLNNPMQLVSWKTTLGTIDEFGELTAPAAQDLPQTGMVTATSLQDTTKVDSVIFTVKALTAQPVIRTVSVVLGEENGPAANLVGVMVSFHLANGPHNTKTALFQSVTQVTDNTGRLTFSFASSLILPGEAGLLSVLMPDGRHYLGLATVA